MKTVGVSGLVPEAPSGTSPFFSEEHELEELMKRIEWLQEKRPAYKEILEFYGRVRKEQERLKPLLKLGPIPKNPPVGEGFPLLKKEDLPLDIETSLMLFRSLCRIGKEANPHMAGQVERIEEAVKRESLDVTGLMKTAPGDEEIEQAAEQLGLDGKVLSFLIRSSTRPSIESAKEALSQNLDVSHWSQHDCPICGSLPRLSLLRGEAGNRHLVCSYCGYQWRFERVVCPFCDNREADSISYLFAEGEEAYRIDVCEKCHQYIKTLDLRVLEEIDPCLEDLATLHLDLLASERGYKRPVPNPWVNERRNLRI